MRKVWIRRAIALAALGVVVYLFWPLLKDIRAAAQLFRDAHWEWLAAAVLIQCLSYASLTWLNVLALKPFSGHIGFLRLALVLTAMAFITAAVPSAGASGIVLRARLLAKFGYTAEASTFSMLLELIFIVVGTVLVALFGLGYLLQIGQLAAIEIALLVIVILLAAMLVWVGWRLASDPLRSLRLMQRLVGIWNRLAGRFRLKPVDPQAVASRLEAFNRGLKELREVPRWAFFVAAAGRILLDVGTLGACFALLGHLIRPDILLISYGLIMVISSLAILPGGLGLADVSLPVVFNRLGVPGSLALAAGLTYRLLAFWLVRFIGFVSWQLLEGSTERKLKRGENP
jgi:uncharacterized protein (TIRG00374 family)